MSTSFKNKRTLFQSLAALGLNIDLISLVRGRINLGITKNVCVPAMNCSSCPAAIATCPVGAVQNALTTVRSGLSRATRNLAITAIISMIFVGQAVGRLPCGWFCPFGFLQDVLYKVPVRKLKIPDFLTALRLPVFALTVFLLPVLLVDSGGSGTLWFCKWFCPAGTLESWIPQFIVKPDLFSGIINRLALKVFILILFLAWMSVSRRPFCKVLCPIGLSLGFFNKRSIFKVNVDTNRCLKCNACQRNCPANIRVYENPNSSFCFRCLGCEDVCPVSCVSHGFKLEARKNPSTGT